MLETNPMIVTYMILKGSRVVMKLNLREINISSSIRCPLCKGTGRVWRAVAPYPDELHDCPICRSKGQIIEYRMYEGKRL